MRWIESRPELPAALGRPGLLAATVLLCLVPTTGAPRWLQVLSALALVLALGGIGARLARRAVPRASPAEHLFVTAIHASAVCVVAVVALGAAGLLRPGLFRAVVACGLLAAWWPAKARPARHPAVPERALLGRPEIAALLGLLIAALASFLWIVASHWSTAPGPFLYDDISYHLSAVATWWGTGDLRMLKFAHGDPATTFYPIVSEILGWVLVAPLDGSDFLARFGQLPMALLVLLGVYLVARRLGASRSGALCGVLLVLAIPRAFPQLALSAGNDHSTALFALASAHAALCLRRSPRTGTAAYAGVCLGLLAGTKYLGLLLAAPLTLPMAIALREGMRSDAGRGAFSPARLLGAAAGSSLLVGGYTYARNAWVTGNPFYPLPVELLGATLLPGSDSATVAARRAAAAEHLGPVEMLWGHVDLWGPLFRLTLLPLAVVAVAAAVGARRRLGPTRLTVALLAPVLALLTLVGTYDHRDIRYLLGAAALGAATGSWFLSRLREPFGTVLRLAVGGAALVPWIEDWSGREPVAVAAGAAAALGCWLAGRSRLRLPTSARRLTVRVAIPVALAAVAILALPLGSLVERYQRLRLDADPAAESLDRLTGGSGTAVAYAGSNAPYLYFGRELENRVHIVPTRTGPNEMTYDWDGTARFPFGRAPGAAEIWRRNLELLEIDWVVLVAGERSSPESVWVERRPDLFRAVYRDDVTTVWHHRRPTETSSHRLLESTPTTPRSVP